MEVAGIFVALASEGLIVFLFHFYVNVFSITGKWENILSTRFQGFIPACAG